MLNIKALSHVGSDKKIIENSILKSIFDPVTYLWNQLEWFKKSLVQEHIGIQRRSCFKEIVGARTYRHTDNGPSQKLTLST